MRKNLEKLEQAVEGTREQLKNVRVYLEEVKATSTAEEYQEISAKVSAQVIELHSRLDSGDHPR